MNNRTTLGFYFGQRVIKPRKKRKAPKLWKAPRLPGVFVIEVKPEYSGPSIEKGHYFPTSLQASQFLGFRSNVVGKALHRAKQENKNFECAVISGIEFQTVNRAYQNAKEIDLLNAHPILQRHFPWLFREDGYAISNPDEARRRRARAAKTNGANLPVADEETRVRIS